MEHQPVVIGGRVGIVMLMPAGCARGCRGWCFVAVPSLPLLLTWAIPPPYVARNCYPLAPSLFQRKPPILALTRPFYRTRGLFRSIAHLLGDWSSFRSPRARRVVHAWASSFGTHACVQHVMILFFCISLFVQPLPTMASGYAGHPRAFPVRQPLETFFGTGTTRPGKRRPGGSCEGAGLSYSTCLFYVVLGIVQYAEGSYSKKSGWG